MFIIIKYYDNQEEIVNINCPIRIVLDYIESFFSESLYSGKLDLCNTKGEVQNLTEEPFMKKAPEILIPRSTYIPAFVTRSDDRSITRIEPLLFEVQKLFPEFTETLSPIINPATGNVENEAKEKDRRISRHNAPKK